MSQTNQDTPEPTKPGNRFQSPVYGGKMEGTPQSFEEGKSKQKKTKLSKKLIIIVVSVLSALLVGFIAYVVYIATFSVDYKDAYSKSTEVSDSWNEFSKKHNITSDSLNLDVTNFDSQLSEEKSAFDNFKKSYKKLENTSMLKDGEIKSKYDVFISRVNLVIPKIETYLQTATPIHDFSIKLSKLEGKTTLTDAQITDLVSSLVVSENAKLKNFGQKYDLYSKKMYSAVSRYNKTHLDSDYDKLTEAKLEFATIIDELSTLNDNLGVVSSGDISQMTAAWHDLSVVISNKFSNVKN